MDEFNEMLEYSKLEPRAIFHIFYHPGISLDGHSMGLPIFPVLARIIFKFSPTVELPSFISSSIRTTRVSYVSQFYLWDNIICSLYQCLYCDRELGRLRDTLSPHYLPHRPCVLRGGCVQCTAPTESSFEFSCGPSITYG